MLAGIVTKKRIELKGTGEMTFTFDEEKQRIDMRYDIAGIDFKTDFPQFVEKMIKDKFVKELKGKPHYAEFDFKPLKVKLGDKVTWGHYHVKEVITVKNRLMAIADLIFKDSKQGE
jgi:hypothetical protein